MPRFPDVIFSHMPTLPKKLIERALSSDRVLLKPCTKGLFFKQGINLDDFKTGCLLLSNIS